MAGQFTVTGMAAGLPSGQQQFGPLTIPGAVSIGEQVVLSLASGDNTIAIPTGSVAVLIVPPTNNSASLTLRHNALSVGISLAPGLPFGPYAFPATVTSLILNSGGAVSAFTTVAFI